MFRLSFRGRLQSIQYDFNRESKARSEKERKIVFEATREWMREVIRLAIWRGFMKGSVVNARGQFGDLARYLRLVTDSATQTRSSKTKPRYYYHDDGRKVPKRPDRGGVFGHYAFSDTEGQSKNAIGITGDQHRFTFHSDVVYFTLRDMFGFIPHVGNVEPSRFMYFAGIAFNDYIHMAIAKEFKGHLKNYIVRTLYYESDGRGPWVENMSCQPH